MKYEYTKKNTKGYSYGYFRIHPLPQCHENLAYTLYLLQECDPQKNDKILLT